VKERRIMGSILKLTIKAFDSNELKPENAYSS
jgi:hypothetical protein